MNSIAIKNTLHNKEMLAPRLRTDKLFVLPAGCLDFRGYLDDTVRLVEEIQLSDRPLWSKFVQVFTDRPDGENRGWRGEYWGKMMRGACITYHYTQTPELLEILSAATRALLETADEDGRISSYEKDLEYKGWDVWSRKYVLLGLEHFYEICPDEELKAAVLAAACAHADYILATLGKGKIDITTASNAWEGVNSSSILEPMVRLYSLTGEQKYLDFATYIVERGGGQQENIFETAYQNEKLPHEYRITKAYETISCFEGLLEYYRVTGIEKWRDAAINLGRRICESEVSVIGTGGCWHELFDHTKTRQLATNYTGVQQETCVTVTWMKFCLQLLCLTGDPAFADELEKSIYNALLGAVNHERCPQHGGLPFDSYSPILFGARARETGGRQMLADGSHYGCCASIGAAGTGLIPLSSMLLREDGVAVNLYAPGTAALSTPTGAPLEISIKTNYPADGAISLSIDTTDDQPFTVALRVPAWSHLTTLAVNGQLIDAQAGKYAEVTRVWSCGDTVELFLDMRTELIRPEGQLPDKSSPHHVALRRGPLTLARDARLAGDMHAPVSLSTDAQGFAEVELVAEHTIKCNYAFRAKQTDGSFIELVDYASAGKVWGNRALVSAWLPTRSYAKVDLTKPFMIKEPTLAGGNTPMADPNRPVYLQDGVVLSGPVGEPMIVTLCDEKDDAYRMRVGEDYLAIDEDGRLVTTDRKGGRFTLIHQGLDRYAFATPDGRLLAFAGRVTTPMPIFLSDARDIDRKHIFTLCNVEETI